MEIQSRTLRWMSKDLRTRQTRHIDKRWFKHWASTTSLKQSAAQQSEQKTLIPRKPNNLLDTERAWTIRTIGSNIELHARGQVPHAICSKQERRTKMATPTCGSWKKVEEVCEQFPWERFLCLGKCKPLENSDELEPHVHVDSDWANDPERKSTSGGMAMISGTSGGTVDPSDACVERCRECCAIVTGTAEALRGPG